MPRYVTSPGDFKWMPKYTMGLEEGIPLLRMTNGLGVTRTARLGGNLTQKFKLYFEASLATYREIRDFLRSKGYGRDPFTWRHHEENQTLTVYSAKPFDVEYMTDNTADQNVLAVRFTLEFERASDVAAL